MEDYKLLYFKLATRVADVIDLLVGAQQEAEEDLLAMGDVSDTEEPKKSMIVSDSKGRTEASDCAD